MPANVLRSAPRRVGSVTRVLGSIPTVRQRSGEVKAKTIKQPVPTEKIPMPWLATTRNFSSHHRGSLSKESSNFSDWDDDLDDDFDPESDDRTNWNFRKNITFTRGAKEAAREFELWKKENQPNIKTMLFMVNKFLKADAAELSLTYMEELADSYPIGKAMLKKLMREARRLCIAGNYKVLQEKLSRLAQANQIQLSKMPFDKKCVEPKEIGGIDTRNPHYKYLVSGFLNRDNKKKK